MFSEFERCDTEVEENTIKETEFFLHNGTACGEYSGVGNNIASALVSCPEEKDEGYIWRDSGWHSYVERTCGSIARLPLNIYGAELSRWHSCGGASELATYVKQMGYTHICVSDALVADEAECGQHKLSGHFGSSNELKSFVDQMHEAGIGVLLDWTLFSAQDREAAILDALRWLSVFHIDGLKIISPLLDNLTDESIYFLKTLNATVKNHLPSAILIAEVDTESDVIGCGFDLVCNTARLEALFRYLAEDPFFRKHHHAKIIAQSEMTSVLPIAHLSGESLFDAVSGDRWQRLATLRAVVAYQITMPSKKLLQMGNELALGTEENFGRVEDEDVARLQLCISELNHLYLETLPLCSSAGFEWIDAEDSERSMISYARTDASGEIIVVVVNFTPVVREGYVLGVPEPGEYEEIFNSDELRFGGSGVVNARALQSSDFPINGRSCSVTLRIPPLGATVLRHKGKIS